MIMAWQHSQRMWSMQSQASVSAIFLLRGGGLTHRLCMHGRHMGPVALLLDLNG
jgi:hypothetical protein